MHYVYPVVQLHTLLMHRDLANPRARLPGDNYVWQSAMQDPTITVASCEARRFGERNPSHLLSKFPLRDPDDLRFPILQFAH